MPTFICYRGDCTNLALLKGRPVFPVKDDDGTDWLCVDYGGADLEQEILKGHPSELVQAQRLAHKQRLSKTGSSVALVNCETIEELPNRLSSNPRLPEPDQFIMNQLFPPIEVPLRSDGGGGFHVGKTRVSLDQVIHAFNDGADPESICHTWDTLELADVYAVITHYLRNKRLMDEHLAARKKEAETIRQQITQSHAGELQAKLRARKAERVQGHAAIHQ